ncbi:MAG: hypothetical protein Q7S61_05715 [bacterium]|nr:hypothetical protein [bacterium]
MKKTILNKQQIIDLARENRYKVNTSTRFISRCIDGRYVNDDELPALAFPGADAGDLALLYATAANYGFEVDYEKALTTLIEIVGGEKNMRMHTDTHREGNGAALGCGHIKQMRLDPEAYHLTSDQIRLLDTQLEKVKKDGGVEVVLEGEHMEGAVVIVKGPYSLKTRLYMETPTGKREVEIFVLHQTLADERHRAWVTKLIEKKAIELYADLDEEYVYQALSDIAENHLMETAKRIAGGLPMYSVTFKNDGMFEVESIGNV